MLVSLALGLVFSLSYGICSLVFGLQIKNNSLDPLIVETDCLFAANLLNGALDYSTHHYAPIIDMCRSTLALLIMKKKKSETPKIKKLKIEETKRIGNGNLEQAYTFVLK